MKTPIAMKLGIVFMCVTTLIASGGGGPSGQVSVPTDMVPPPATTPSTAATTPTTAATTPTIATVPTVAPTLQNTALAPSTAVVLTLNTGTNTLGSLAGAYTHSTKRVTSGASNYGVAANGNSFVGSISGGGNNQIVALQTLVADMPLSGGAAYNGTADVAYLDTPSGRLFDGTMAAQITATFTGIGGTVDVTLTSPNGTFGGANYTGPGQAAINGLVINGAGYASAGASTASVIGFNGSTDLNSVTQTVKAQGVFGGPNAEETGAVAVIEDGVNGQALISLIGRQ
jgi:hypothetical protein